MTSSWPLIGLLTMMQNCRLPTDVSLEGDVSREDSIVTVALQPFYSFLEDYNLQLTASQSDEVVDMFVEMGADGVEDLDFVNERDLAGILPLIKCRKLMFFINKMKSQRNVISADPIVNSADSTVTSRSSVASGGESSNVHHKSSNIPSIPWQRFSKGVRQCLEKEKRPTPKERREVVRVLCDEINDKCPAPQRQDMRNLADIMVKRFPVSFEDRSFGDKLIKDGDSTLFTQIENRLYNMKRGSDTSTEASSENEGSSKKKSLWHLNPEYMQPSISTSNELENWRSDLLKMFEDEEVDTKKINSTLIKCLPFVQESVQTRSLKEIQPDWPILFTLIGFKLHYQAVMKKSLDDLLEMIIKSRRNVMGYM